MEISAASLYEGVALALAQMRQDSWVDAIGEGLTEVRVRVSQPLVEHRVFMKVFRHWLARSSTSNRRGPGGRRLVDVQSKYKYCGSTAESNLDIATGVQPAKTGEHPALSDPALVVGSITLCGYITGS